MKDSHKNGFVATGVIFYTLFTFAAMACAGTYSGGTKINPGISMEGIDLLID